MRNGSGRNGRYEGVVGVLLSRAQLERARVSTPTLLKFADCFGSALDRLLGGSGAVSGVVNLVFFLRGNARSEKQLEVFSHRIFIQVRIERR